MPSEKYPQEQLTAQSQQLDIINQVHAQQPRGKANWPVRVCDIEVKTRGFLWITDLSERILTFR
jgi:hypothetical protein